MCGRYVAASSPGELADYFGASSVAASLSEPNYNVAPSVDVPVVVTNQDKRELGLMRWGFIPFWAKTASAGNKMINARSETVVEKNAFRRAAKTHRCLIPADAFYEWTSVVDPAQKKPRKQPWCIQRADGAPFAFAGLHTSWRDPDGDGTRIRSCTILTRSANRQMQPIHDRMPVMIPPDRWEAWLDPNNDDVQNQLDAIEAPPDGALTIYAVSTAVNNSRSSGIALLDEVEPMTDESLASAHSAGDHEQGSLL